ncbi:CHAT domain-containing protein [Winogradskyella sp. PG-2]|uniref:CHAT domain-containing protein n=1 Tax=Winogradskyella sp. PG-2 TaxID=754409 RepID=UPI00045863BF|nr:CHAT domain-containing protein [Winogradskyella sp. PG-2]BAO75176.1 TPR repeat [Winogradskyella sp. PG-2]
MLFNCKLNHAFICIVSNIILISAQSVSSQQKDSINSPIVKKAEKLWNQKKYDDLLKLCKNELPNIIESKVQDSSKIALLYNYQYEAQTNSGFLFESLKSIESGIKFCTNSQEDIELKGVLYYRKAYVEDGLKFFRRSFKSMQNSVRELEKLENINGDFSVGAYNYLSQSAADNGDLEEAQRYIRLAERIYYANKDAIHESRADADGIYDRYEVMFPYKKLYAFSKLADSLTVIGYMNELEELHSKTTFNIKYESIYYTASLNLIGDWYATRKHENELTKVDTDKALFYINKSLYYAEDKGYAGNELQFKYNKCKVLALANRLNEAKVLINKLLLKMSERDGRRPFFLAQKGLIEAKMKQKNSALNTFYNAIKSTHTGDSALAKDYSNFKPNQSFNRTKLFLRIAEKLNNYFGSDKEVKYKISQLYYMAFIQFENSYDRSKFNKKDNELLKEIIQGILRMKAQGYGLNNFNEQELINRSEIIKNQLSWKRFNQNRHANSLQQLDSLQQRKLNLRTAMAYAKSENNISSQDSLNTLIENTDVYSEKIYPNLNLFTKKKFDLTELQAQLNPNDVVLKYIVLKDEIAIFKISKTDFDVVLKPFGELEKNLITTVINQVKQKQYDDSVSKKLATILIPDLSSSIEHLIVNPDGLLRRLPFEILKQDNTFLINNYRVSYTSSLGFIHPELPETNIEEVLAIYVPDYGGKAIASATRSAPMALIGAQNEAEAISTVFPSTIYKASSTGKKEFLETAKDARLLHMAMHAEVNNEEPGLSQLLFNISKSDKSNLYLEEIYGLSLNADLAVLSACNTGVGKENEDVKIESFQRAFTFAGVPATVASLWEVPDLPTKEIMVFFYENLEKGQTKSLALKNAKLAYIDANRNTKLAEPYYWAGFVLYGVNDPITEPNYSFIWLSIGVAVLLYAFWFWRRSRIRAKTTIYS